MRVLARARVAEPNSQGVREWLDEHEYSFWSAGHGLNGLPPLKRADLRQHQPPEKPASPGDRPVSMPSGSLPGQNDNCLTGVGNSAS